MLEWSLDVKMILFLPYGEDFIYYYCVCLEMRCSDANSVNMQSSPFSHDNYGNR